jgi:hypothetical protein
MGYLGVESRLRVGIVSNSHLHYVIKTCLFAYQVEVVELGPNANIDS